MSGSKYVLFHVKQLLTDTIRRRKRVASDGIFCSLGYNILPSRATERNFGAACRLFLEIRIKKNNVVNNGEWEHDNSGWCQFKAEKRVVEGQIVPSDDSATPTPTGSDPFPAIKKNVSVVVFQERIGYVLCSNPTDLVDGTIVAISWLDAWISTVVTGLSDDDKRGVAFRRGIKMFYSYIPLDLSQITGSITSYL